MVEYVSEPQLDPIPLAPAHCLAVFFRSERVVPVMDVDRIWHADMPTARADCVVLAYQARARAPLRHVGIFVGEPPQQIVVSDEQACELPDRLAGEFRHLARSCFRYHDTATPVLDIAYLCSRQLLQTILNEPTLGAPSLGCRTAAD